MKSRDADGVDITETLKEKLFEEVEKIAEQVSRTLAHVVDNPNGLALRGMEQELARLFWVVLDRLAAAVVVVDQKCLGVAASLKAAVSADDGHISRVNLEGIRNELGALASFSGAKGQCLTPPVEWDDDAHRALLLCQARVEGQRL